MYKIKTYMAMFQIVALGILFNSSSCKREKETVCSPENTVYYPKDALDRFYFLDSSYWIYKDSVTGQEDSVWIENSLKSVGNFEKMAPQSKGKCFEGAIYNYCSLLAQKWEILFTTNPSKPGTEAKNELFTIEISQGSYGNTYAVIQGSEYKNDGKEYGTIDIFPILTINGVEYHDVLRKTNDAALLRDIYYTSYSVKNIGIVKFVRNNKSVWELVRYRIKQ